MESIQKETCIRFIQINPTEKFSDYFVMFSTSGSNRYTYILLSNTYKTCIYSSPFCHNSPPATEHYEIEYGCKIIHNKLPLGIYNIAIIFMWYREHV